MFKSYLVLNTFYKKQAVFLIQQRKLECDSKEELKSILVEDLFSRRFKLRRIPVQYSWLQNEVAKRLYWYHRLISFLKGAAPDFSIDETNTSWLTCLHRAADMMNDCLELGYLKCVGENKCDLLQITLQGSNRSSFYAVAVSLLKDFGPLLVSMTSKR